MADTKTKTKSSRGAEKSSTVVDAGRLASMDSTELLRDIATNLNNMINFPPKRNIKIKKLKKDLLTQNKL